MEPSLTEIWRKYSCEEYFNPSALSDHSTSVYKSIEDARKKVAASLGADADEIYFVIDELKKALPALRFERFSDCAGLITIQKEEAIC